MTEDRAGQQNLRARDGDPERQPQLGRGQGRRGEGLEGAQPPLARAGAPSRAPRARCPPL